MNKGEQGAVADHSIVSADRNDMVHIWGYRLMGPSLHQSSLRVCLDVPG